MSFLDPSTLICSSNKTLTNCITQNSNNMLNPTYREVCTCMMTTSILAGGGANFRAANNDVSGIFLYSLPPISHFSIQSQTVRVRKGFKLLLIATKHTQSKALFTRANRFPWLASVTLIDREASIARWLWHSQDSHNHDLIKRTHNPTPTGSHKSKFAKLFFKW